jgi:hypothetical protein
VVDEWRGVCSWFYIVVFQNVFDPLMVFSSKVFE